MNQQISPFIYKLLEYTRLAPSVHNTQPWHFTVEDSTLIIAVDPQRVLHAGDPTQRELWISLGCCIETLFQSAKGLGLKAELQFLQTESASNPIARFQITKGLDSQREILDLLARRHSYRGPMEQTQLPADLIQNCKYAIKDLDGVSVSFINSKKDIDHIANLTNKGMSLALSSPDFRKELAGLINYNWSQSRIGMPGFVLNRSMLGSIWEKWSVRFGISIKQKAQADQQKILDASALIFIHSTGDVPSFWLNSGRAYIRVVLEATRADLSHSTLAAPVEAASFHEDIEKMIGTTGRIQTMIRIGKATRSSRQITPRLRVDELT